MPADSKLSDQRRRQSDRREAGLRGSVVLVDDPTQYVATADVAERRGSRGNCTDPCRHFESKAAVRAMLVIVPDVVAKDCFEMVAAENERRPHRGLRLEVPARVGAVTSAPPSLSDIGRRDVLGGLIHLFKCATH